MGKKKVPAMNTSSTADIAFLLLCYFLMTTTMGSQTGLSRRLPPMPDKDQKVEDQKVNRRNIIQVKINSADRILAGSEPIDISQLKDKIKEFLTNPMNDPNLPAPSNDGIYFYGDGRWAFTSSLEDFGGIPVPKRENGMLKNPKESIYEHNEAFLKLMAENNEFFEMDFEDYEPGCVYRYDGRYRITPQWSMLDGITLVAEEIECRDVGTDDRSLIEDDFEEGFYVEDMLNKESFIEAAQELGLTPKQFADTLTAMPSYKGGVRSSRLDTDCEDTNLEYANFGDVIRDVRDYLEKQQGRTT
jgi:biopolymer transport protein ExbD